MRARLAVRAAMRRSMEGGSDSFPRTPSPDPNPSPLPIEPPGDAAGIPPNRPTSPIPVALPLGDIIAGSSLTPAGEARSGPGSVSASAVQGLHSGSLLGNEVPRAGAEAMRMPQMHMTSESDAAAVTDVPPPSAPGEDSCISEDRAQPLPGLRSASSSSSPPSSYSTPPPCAPSPLPPPAPSAPPPGSGGSMGSSGGSLFTVNATTTAAGGPASLALSIEGHGTWAGTPPALAPPAVPPSAVPPSAVPPAEGGSEPQEQSRAQQPTPFWLTSWWRRRGERILGLYKGLLWSFFIVWFLFGTVVVYMENANGTPVYTYAVVVVVLGGLAWGRPDFALYVVCFVLLTCVCLFFLPCIVLLVRPKPMGAPPDVISSLPSFTFRLRTLDSIAEEEAQGGGPPPAPSSAAAAGGAARVGQGQLGKQSTGGAPSPQGVPGARHGGPGATGLSGAAGDGAPGRLKGGASEDVETGGVVPEAFDQSDQIAPGSTVPTADQGGPESMLPRGDQASRGPIGTTEGEEVDWHALAGASTHSATSFALGLSTVQEAEAAPAPPAEAGAQHGVSAGRGGGLGAAEVAGASSSAGAGGLGSSGRWLRALWSGEEPEGGSGCTDSGRVPSAGASGRWLRNVVVLDHTSGRGGEGGRGDVQGEAAGLEQGEAEGGTPRDWAGRGVLPRTATDEALRTLPLTAWSDSESGDPGSMHMGASGRWLPSLFADEGQSDGEGRAHGRGGREDGGERSSRSFRASGRWLRALLGSPEAGAAAGAGAEDVELGEASERWPRNQIGVLWEGTAMERTVTWMDAECAICLERYSDGEELRELPCRHHFHRECVDEWLHRNSVCPLCKGNIQAQLQQAPPQPQRQQQRRARGRHVGRRDGRSSRNDQQRRGQDRGASQLQQQQQQQLAPAEGETEAAVAAQRAMPRGPETQRLGQVQRQGGGESQGRSATGRRWWSFSRHGSGPDEGQGAV